jgi:predicted GIY-YIG superfamily endonuclease
MHEGSYFTYIMASRSRTLYVGVTGNLQRVTTAIVWCGSSAIRMW